MRILIASLLAVISPVMAYAANWTDRGNYSMGWYNASKTEFEISSAKDFAGIAVLVNEGYTDFNGKTITLTGDISLSPNTWIPIGIKDRPFRGTIKGNGHKISGMYVPENTEENYREYYGLLGNCIYATVSDLTIAGSVNPSFDAYYTTQYVGGVCGYASRSEFKNITSLVDVIYKRLRTGTFDFKIMIGGVFGGLEYCTLTNVRNIGDYDKHYKVEIGNSMTSEYYTSGSEFFFGGIVAKDYMSTITNCSTCSWFDVYLKNSKNCSKNKSLIFGGIVGKPSDSKIERCHSIINNITLTPPSGDNSSNIYFGGICGMPPANYGVDYGYIKNCYSVIDVIMYSINSIASSRLYFGGIMGDSSTALSNASQRYKYNYSNNDYTLLNTSSGGSKNIELGYFGNTDFTMSSMKSIQFVEELNLCYTLNGEKPQWCTGGGDNNAYPIVDPIRASGGKFDINDLQYTIISKSGKTAEVAKGNGVEYYGDITIPETAVIDGVTYKIVGIGEGAFKGCTNLTSITLSPTTWTIKASAFEGCSSLTSFTNPHESFRAYGDAFVNCPNLKSVYISDLEEWCCTSFLDNTGANPLWNGADLYLNGEKVTELQYPILGGDQFAQFVKCRSIEKATYPEGYQHIEGGRVFQYCNNLKEIVLPSTMLSIAGYTFANCSSLKNIYCHATTPPNLETGWNNMAFDEYYAFYNTSYTLGRITLHVPRGCKQAYSTAKGWSNFSAIVDDLEPEAGVDDMEADRPDVPVEYFNLQGVKMNGAAESLPRGIYIKRRAGKSEKVVIR